MRLAELQRGLEMQVRRLAHVLKLLLCHDGQGGRCRQGRREVAAGGQTTPHAA